MTRILVAEDEPDIRELVTFTLQFAGYEIVTVTNGAELVERAPQVMPDVIVSDVRMPKMTGYEACRVLKENPATAKIPFVFLSAKGQEEEVKAGLSSGGDDYILKPFAPDELVFRIKQIMARLAEGGQIAAPKPIEPTPYVQVIAPALPPRPTPPSPEHGTKPLNPTSVDKTPSSTPPGTQSGTPPAAPPTTPPATSSAS